MQQLRFTGKRRFGGKVLCLLGNLKVMQKQNWELYLSAWKVDLLENTLWFQEGPRGLEPPIYRNWN